MLSCTYLDCLMLEFWFDPKVAVTHKALFCVCLIALIALLYFMQPLGVDAILMFVGTGLIFLICRYCNIHMIQQPTRLARLLHWIPIALLCALIFMQLQHGDMLLLGAQGIAWMVLGVCVFSPFSLFKKPQTHA